MGIVVLDQGPVGQVTVFWGLGLCIECVEEEQGGRRRGSTFTTEAPFTVFFCFPKASNLGGEGSSCTHSLLGFRDLRRQSASPMWALQIIESVLEGALALTHSSQWTSHLAADQNCLLKKTDSCGPSENNYIQISRGRPWESPCTLATRTPGPESNCLHQTTESPPKASPASA